MEALESSSPLIVYIDIKSPYAFVAIAPILNYLLASVGFFLLLMWAAMNGMFHDIERPKHKLLEQEEQLDALERKSNRYSRAN